MSLENKKENNQENNQENYQENYRENYHENNEENNKGNFQEGRYVKKSIDYGSCEPFQSRGDGENEFPIDLEENDLNELALLGFFNDFALIDMGIHEFIREVYFDE